MIEYNTKLPLHIAMNQDFSARLSPKRGWVSLYESCVLSGTSCENQIGLFSGKISKPYHRRYLVWASPHRKSVYTKSYTEKCMLCNGFVRLRFHRVIQQQYDSYTPQLTSGGLKPGLSGLRDLSASTDFILLNLALAKDTFLLTSGGFRVHVMSASSQISSCINNSSTSSRVIMPTTRYEDNTKLRFVKRNVTRSRPAH